MLRTGASGIIDHYGMNPKAFFAAPPRSTTPSRRGAFSSVPIPQKSPPGPVPPNVRPAAVEIKAPPDVPPMRPPVVKAPGMAPPPRATGPLQVPPPRPAPSQTEPPRRPKAPDTVYYDTAGQPAPDVRPVNPVVVHLCQILLRFRHSHYVQRQTNHHVFGDKTSMARLRLRLIRQSFRKQISNTN